MMVIGDEQRGLGTDSDGMQHQNETRVAEVLLHFNGKVALATVTSHQPQKNEQTKEGSASIPI